MYATVTEQLNSSGWQERLAACTALPMLHGPVTKVRVDAYLGCLSPSVYSGGGTQRSDGVDAALQFNVMCAI